MAEIKKVFKVIPYVFNRVKCSNCNKVIIAESKCYYSVKSNVYACGVSCVEHLGGRVIK